MVAHLGIGLLGYIVAMIIAGVIQLPFSLFALSSGGRVLHDVER